VGSIEDLLRDLRRYDDRKVLLRELRKEMRKPVPPLRRKIKRRALAMMPRRGGLNRWVASTRITAKVQVSSRQLRVQLRGGRNSANKRSDMRAIDRGRVRHPSWGHRGRGAWHNQRVAAGYFTAPTLEYRQWRDACLRAVDGALDTIRRGR
jgi:hypothetical protein